MPAAAKLRPGHADVPAYRSYRPDPGKGLAGPGIVGGARPDVLAFLRAAAGVIEAYEHDSQPLDWSIANYVADAVLHRRFLGLAADNPGLRPLQHTLADQPDHVPGEAR